jgi:DNA (cytosine-5)-methyltransferase 1
MKGFRRYNQMYDDSGLVESLDIAAGGGHQPVVLSGMEIRRLTPIECERLQGFPDNWTEYGTEGKISDTQRYKVLGNAVTTNVISYLGKYLFN